MNLNNKIRVIFFDIDGVLNIRPLGRDEFGALFNQEFEDNLKRIIDKTGAKIVISSTWKMSGLIEMQRMWKQRGLAGEVIDVTCDCAQIVDNGTCEFYDKVERGHEIQEWLDRHPEVISYVIIDDCNDMLQSQMANFVRTANNHHHEDSESGFGLTKQCAEEAIKILNAVKK